MSLHASSATHSSWGQDTLTSLSFRHQMGAVFSYGVVRKTQRDASSVLPGAQLPSHSSVNGHF